MLSDELKIKIGRLFMVGVPGTKVSEDFSDFCLQHHVGNFCLSAMNAYSTQGLCAMTHDLRKIALQATGEYPFLAIDQEGGWVTRFYEGAAQIPGAMAYSAMGKDAKGMHAVGYRLGKILRAAGCNINDAPVLDVNMDPRNPIIGTRSYSDRPEEVLKRGKAFSAGLQEAGVITAVKHFPGHGNVSSDTHLATAVNQVDGETLRKTEFMPFQKVFEAGAGALMTAHVTFSALEDSPATLSRKIMTDLLRKEMKFDGVAITDALGMSAIAKAFPRGEAAVRAIEAGCDQLLYYSFKPEVVEEAFKAVYAAVESGRLTEERINESCCRITRQIERFAIADAEPNLELANRLIYDEEAIRENQKDMRSAITRIWDNGILSRLDGKKILCVSPVCDAVRGVEESLRQTLSFADIFKDEFENCIACVSSLDGMTEAVERAMQEEFDLAVVGIFDVNAKPQQLEVLRAMEKKGKPIVAVLLKSPYEAREVSGCNAAITGYGYTTLAVQAIVSAMKANDYQGVLPVQLPV